MSELGIATAASDKILLAVLSYLNEGNIEDAVAIFADQFSFKDHGIQLEFNTKERLTEFFQKARELYPDMLLQINTIFVSGDRALSEWTLQTTLLEPFSVTRNEESQSRCMGLPWFAPKTAGSQAGSTTMTVSSPGARRWRHISQNGSSTEVLITAIER
jgi:hypothetical protein